MKYAYILHLFQSIMIGLVHDQPDDPIGFMIDGLEKVRSKGGARMVDWDDFFGCTPRSVFDTGKSIKSPRF